MKINHLTPEQQARMAEFRDKWIQIGLSTEPADRPKAEAAINECYRLAGLPPPQKIVWCGSPLSQGLTRAIIIDKKMMKTIGDSVWDSVGDSVWDSVWDSVRDSVGDSVWDSVRDSVRDSVGASVRDSVRDSAYGQHDANWLAFYEYFRLVCGLESQTEKLAGMTEQAKHAGWFLPHQNICWVSERHNVLVRDERGRLHCETGPAVAYPDGWAIYAIHGVRVPADIIENPDSITVTRIANETNAEIRRVMIDRYGAARYLLDSGAEQVHKDEWGILYRRELQEDEPIVMVRLLNSTPEPDGVMSTAEAIQIFGEAAVNKRLATMQTLGAPVDPDPRWKQYMLRVPPAVTTAKEAVAWTCGVESGQFAPEIES